MGEFRSLRNPTSVLQTCSEREMTSEMLGSSFLLVMVLSTRLEHEQSRYLLVRDDGTKAPRVLQKGTPGSLPFLTGQSSVGQTRNFNHRLLQRKRGNSPPTCGQTSLSYAWEGKTPT